MRYLNNYYEKIFSNNDTVVKNFLSKGDLLGGKKLRAALVFLCAGISGEISQRTEIAAFAFELLHYASLIHDDVLDDGQKRHNHPTINATYGNKAAILTGDYLLAECMFWVAQENYPELLISIASVAKAMLNGELMQLGKKSSPIFSEKKYMKMIQYKTAALIGACCEIGISSGISDLETISHWKRLGEDIGIIFQLRDDLLDYMPCSSSQKDPYKDIKNHRTTLPFIYAYRQTPDSEKQDLLHLYRYNSGSPEEIQRIIRIVKKRGGIKYTNKKIEQIAEKCINFIVEQERSIYRKSLLMLVQFICEREY
jgi:octaprenyl-diphosphate synthase